MTATWTEQVQWRTDDARVEALQRIVQFSEGPALREGAYHRGLAAIIKDDQIPDMVRAADTFAWDEMQAAMGRMNKPIGSGRQERFLNRAALEYLALFVRGLKKEAIRRVESDDTQGTQSPSKGECLALIHVTGRVLEWAEEERAS